jgi:predicted GH43/DUF377 family glycosyl hydrolase
MPSVYNHLHKFIAACGFLALLAVPGYASSDSLELCSPKNEDHFEVPQPLLFWRSSQDAQRYEVYIDNIKAGEVQAVPVPVVNYAPATPLAAGPHHWFVKAISATGKTHTSAMFTFTVDPPGNWPSWAIGPFVRYGKNPLLFPQGTDWESRNVYNPGVLFDEGRFRMLYRAQGKPVTSREGYAECLDGVSFARDPAPLIDATEPFEQKYGCEDARFFKYEETYYAFYTGNSGTHMAQCEATSPDGRHWKKLGPIAVKTKNAAVVCDPNGAPVKINGKFVMYIGNNHFNVCYSDDLIHWGPLTRIDMKLPAGWVTPYEPCFAIANHSATRPDDVVLFIAGTLNGKGKWFYAISEVLFSKKDLTTKVGQLDDCIMKATEPYESGEFEKCLWMNCIIQYNRQWMMYYGAGDRNVGLATAPVK